jgi:hypothetical protein
VAQIKSKQNFSSKINFQKMKKRFNSMAELHAAAENSENRFANLDGGLTVMQNRYTGQDDVALDISGDIQNFVQEGSVDKQIILQITNAAESARTAVLFPGYNLGNTTTRPGQITDGAFSDVDGNPGLSASSGRSGVTVKEILAFVKEFPTRVVATRIQSTVANQIQQTLEIGTLDIFKKKGGETLYPSTGVNGNTFNDKISTIETPGLQLDALSDISYTFVAGSTTTITLFCGATLNKAKELREKAAIATRNLRGY